MKAKKKKKNVEKRESTLTVQTTLNTEADAAPSSLGHLNSGADTKEIFEPAID